MVNKAWQTQEDQYFKTSGRFVHIILWCIAVFLAIMLLWSKFAVLDEVTNSEGKVIPSQKIQIVDNLEGGIIKAILVHEGDVVKQGQAIIQLDEVRFLSNFREEQTKEVALKLKLSRLQAEANNLPFTVEPKLAKDYPDIAHSEEELYNSRKMELESLNKKRELIVAQVNMTRPLVKSGAVSQVELLQLEQGLYEVDNTISRFRSSTLQELNGAKAELSRLTETQTSIKDQLDRTNVRSPVHGIIKQIYANTVGGTVKPGVPLMEIVPLDDRLLVEARVKPRDVGFLRLKQKATVKFSAYDYSIYGGMEGKVEHISADTSTDEKGNSYYELWVRTDRNYLEHNGQKLEIIPGMQVTVDILTGQKSVLDYLLKPIMKARSEALRER